MRNTMNIRIVVAGFVVICVFVAGFQAAPAQESAKVFGRHVPERKDDFAWENDRIAFRMYGPALEADGEISSGIDV